MASIYVTNAQFFTRCIPALKGADETLVTQAGVDASGEADGYIAKRYALPLVAPFDTGLCLKVFDLMQYNVASQVGFKPGSGQNELLLIKHDKAVEWLTNVSRGLLELPLQLDQTPDVDEDGTLTASNVPMSFRTFTGHAHGCCGGDSCGCGQ